MVNLEDVLYAIEKVSRTVASDYPDVSYDDIYQTLCLFVIKNGKSIKTREEGGKIFWILRKVAHTFARQERAEMLSLSIQYTYRLSDVQKMLEHALRSDSVERTHVPDDARSLAGGDSIEIASDLQAALMRLPEVDREVLFRRYAMNEIPENSSYERKRINAAEKRLTYVLNSYRGRKDQHIGKRRVISNAAAAAIVSNQY